MSNWFKKMFFGSECSCQHCDHCGDKKEVKNPVGANVTPVENKPAENVTNNQ